MTEECLAKLHRAWKSRKWFCPAMERVCRFSFLIIMRLSLSPIDSKAIIYIFNMRSHREKWVWINRDRTAHCLPNLAYGSPDEDQIDKRMAELDGCLLDKYSTKYCAQYQVYNWS